MKNFIPPPPNLQSLTCSNGVSLLALSLTIQMYQICTPKVPRILNPTYHLTLSQTETYVLCVDLIIIIAKQFFPNLNLDPPGGSVAFFGPLSEVLGFFRTPQQYPPHPLVNTL